MKAVPIYEAFDLAATKSYADNVIAIFCNISAVLPLFMMLGRNKEAAGLLKAFAFQWDADLDENMELYVKAVNALFRTINLEHELTLKLNSISPLKLNSNSDSNRTATAT